MRNSYEDIRSRINPSNVIEMIPELEHLSLSQRERLSFETGTRVIYLGQEVIDCQAAEEEAALAAVPRGFDLIELNGLNIGCGDRSISPHLIPVDIARKPLDGGHASATSNAILASPSDLPFKENSVDFIVALHVLEHIADPAMTLRYWLTLLKPGGGIGLVLPDWRYAWDSRNDHSPFGHKWNSTAEVMQSLWSAHLSDVCTLEKIGTIKFAASFDVVLRKPGIFSPFSVDKILPECSVEHNAQGFPLF